MKWSELKQKSDDELRSLRDEFGKERFNLRFQRAQGQLENTARVRIVRRTIARIQTLQNQRRVQA
ncbi:MAG: 50S ribosomal protein L29 [Pseudomonadota bacterium]